MDGEDWYSGWVEKTGNICRGLVHRRGEGLVYRIGEDWSTGLERAGLHC
jgi:hypothetical protein